MPIADRFEASLSSGSGSAAEAFLQTARKALADKLRPIFQQFPKDMISTHGKDLLDDANASPSASGASTPASSSTPAPAASAPAASSASATKAPTAKGLSLNTSTVRASGEFQCDAETLFDFLTNPQKIPAWSRNPAQMAPEVGAEVSLFGGNVRGKIEKVDRPKSFVSTWRAPTWPESHFGQLETTLDQGSSSTTLTLVLRGCPIGKEDETESNVSDCTSLPLLRTLADAGFFSQLHGFYIRGLQSIGLGLLSFSTSSTTSSTASTARPQRRRPQSARVNRWTLANVGSFAVSFGLIAAMGVAFYYGPSGPGGKK